MGWVPSLQGTDPSPQDSPSLGWGSRGKTGRKGYTLINWSRIQTSGGRRRGRQGQVQAAVSTGLSLFHPRAPCFVSFCRALRPWSPCVRHGARPPGAR